MCFAVECYLFHTETVGNLAAGHIIGTIDAETIRDCALQCELNDNCVGFTVIDVGPFYDCAWFDALNLQAGSGLHTYEKYPCDTERMYNNHSTN